MFTERPTLPGKILAGGVLSIIIRWLYGVAGLKGSNEKS